MVKKSSISNFFHKAPAIISKEPEAAAGAVL